MNRKTKIWGAPHGMGIALARATVARDVAATADDLDALADLVEQGEISALVVALVTREGYQGEVMIDLADSRAVMRMTGLLARASTRAIEVAEEGAPR